MHVRAESTWFRITFGDLVVIVMATGGGIARNSHAAGPELQYETWAAQRSYCEYCAAHASSSPGQITSEAQRTGRPEATTKQTVGVALHVHGSLSLSAMGVALLEGRPPHGRCGRVLWVAGVRMATVAGRVCRNSRVGFDGDVRA
jgi:hypothetical protein